MSEPVAEVGYLAGLCGHDGTEWLKVKVDSNGYLRVIGAGVAGAIEVTQDTPADLLTGIHGYTGTAWQKQHLLWGYYDTVSEAVVDLNLVAGTNLLYGTAVPAGEIWIVTTVVGRYDGAVATVLYAGCTVDGVAVSAVSAVPPTSEVWYPGVGQFILREGDKVYCFIYDAAAGDDGFLRYSGYKMKLDM